MLAAIHAELGSPVVLIHNAVGGAVGNFLEIDPQILNCNFQVNMMALLHLARRLAPATIKAAHGVIITTGNTSAQRGRANFAGFAPTKAPQRVLAEAIARAWPQRHSRRLRRDRRRHRSSLDAPALA